MALRKTVDTEAELSALTSTAPQFTHFSDISEIVDKSNGAARLTSAHVVGYGSELGGLQEQQVDAAAAAIAAATSQGGSERSAGAGELEESTITGCDGGHAWH